MKLRIALSVAALWCGLAAGQSVGIAGFAVRLNDGVEVCISARGDITHILCPTGSVRRDGGGTVTDAGGIRIARNGAGVVTKIGGLEVERDGSGAVTRIGKVRVARNGLGMVTRIGDAEIEHNGLGGVTLVGKDRRVRVLVGVR